MVETLIGQFDIVRIMFARVLPLSAFSKILEDQMVFVEVWSSDVEPVKIVERREKCSTKFSQTINLATTFVLYAMPIF